MAFEMDDIDQVLQVIKNIKGIPDVNLQMEFGDTSLLVLKGNMLGIAMDTPKAAHQAV